MQKINILLTVIMCITCEASASKFYSNETLDEENSYSSFPTCPEKEKENQHSFARKSDHKNIPGIVESNILRKSLKEIHNILPELNKNGIYFAPKRTRIKNTNRKRPKGIRKSLLKGGLIKIFSSKELRFMSESQKIIEKKPFIHFSKLMNTTTLEDNIDKARNYASETHEEIQNCLSLITIEGVKKFTPEDFLSTRDLSSQEISLRETRGRLWEVQWEEAEDLYEGEQYDPQAFKVRILTYLEKAYISSLPQRGEFKNQAQGIYQEALNYFHKQCQSAYISNPSLELIGRCALADSQYYRNACSSLYLYNFFKNLFPHPSLELISEYTAFKLAYEKFLMQFGDKFENPFKGYPW